MPTSSLRSPDTPATAAQKDHITNLLERKVVPSRITRVIEEVGGDHMNLLTHEHCRLIIPQLEACPRRSGLRFSDYHAVTTNTATSSAWFVPQERHYSIDPVEPLVPSPAYEVVEDARGRLRIQRLDPDGTTRAF